MTDTTNTSQPTVVVGSDMSPELFLDVAAALRDMGVEVTTDETAGERRPAKVIVVISPKGGSGKTAVATNLSAALAERHPGRVVAVDLDLQFGDLGLALSVVPDHTLAQLVTTTKVDSTALKFHLTPAAGQLFLLAGASGPIEAESVREEHVAEVIPMLAAEFDYVVVDTPAGLDERTLAAIENATDVLLVSSLDVTSIRSLRTAVEALDELGMTAQRSLLLNRAGSQVGLESSDAEDVMDMEITSSIPSSRDIPLSLNLGKPVVLDQPKSPVARRFRELADLFAPVEQSERRKWWSR